MRCQQACTRLRMSWCLGLLEVSPWGQSLTVCPSDCPTICRSSPQIGILKGYLETQGPGRAEEKTTTHSTPLCAVLYSKVFKQVSGQQLISRAGSRHRGRDGAGLSELGWWYGAAGGRRAAVLHRSCSYDRSSTKWPLSQPNSSEPVCPWLPPQVSSGQPSFHCVTGCGLLFEDPGWVLLLEVISRETVVQLCNGMGGRPRLWS